MTVDVTSAGPERVSVLTGSIGRVEFRDYVEWLEHHVGAYGDAWRVKVVEETGIRTVVIFSDQKHKFMFDIAWANDVVNWPHDIVEGILTKENS